MAHSRKETRITLLWADGMPHAAMLHLLRLSENPLIHPRQPIPQERTEQNWLHHGVQHAPNGLVAHHSKLCPLATEWNDEEPLIPASCHLPSEKDHRMMVVARKGIHLESRRQTVVRDSHVSDLWLTHVESLASEDAAWLYPVATRRSKTNVWLYPVATRRGKTNVWTHPLATRRSKTNVWIDPVATRRGKTNVWIDPIATRRGKTNVWLHPLATRRGQANVWAHPVATSENKSKRPISPLINTKQKP